MKKVISLLLLLLLFSSCYTIRTSDGRKGYRLFFNPNVKREYCENNQTVLENAEYFYRKVFGKNKNYCLFNIAVKEEICCFHISYYKSSPDVVEGFDYVGKNVYEITLSKEKHKVLHWR